MSKYDPGCEYGPVRAALLALAEYDRIVRTNTTPAYDAQAAVVADDTGEVFGEVADTASEVTGRTEGEAWREAVDVDEWHDRYLSPMVTAYKAALAVEVADRAKAAEVEAATEGDPLTVAGILAALADALVAGTIQPGQPVALWDESRGWWHLVSEVRIPQPPGDEVGDGSDVAVPTLEVGRALDTRYDA